MNTIYRYKPTRLQRLLLTGQQLQPDSPLYNMAFRFDLYGSLSINRFNKAFNTLISQNECLRLRVSSNGELEILDKLELNLKIIDGDPGSQLLERTRKALDLSVKCFDAELFCVNDQHYIFYLNQHHIITDGAASAEHYRQLGNLYSGISYKPNMTMAEHQDIETEVFQSVSYKAATKYWNEKSNSVLCDQRQTESKSTTKRHSIVLEKSTMLLLEDVKNEPGIRSISTDLTLFSIFAATLVILRYRLFSKDDNTLGVPFHNRSKNIFMGPALEIGLLLVEIKSCVTFVEVVRKIQADVLASMKHSMPGISSANMNNSFSWLLNYVTTNYGNFADLKCEATWLHPDAGDAAHALRLHVHDFNKTGLFTLHFDCSEKDFSEQQCKQLPVLFQRLLQCCLKGAGEKISKHNILSDDQLIRRKKFNRTSLEWPDKSIIQRFREQVSHNPEAIAVKNASRTFTYLQLDRCSNYLANEFKDCSVLPVLIPRSIEAVVAIIAALKISKPFVPMDVEHPESRINAILDALGNPRVVCNMKQSQRNLRCNGYFLVDLQQMQHQRVATNTIQSVAYIIFTSGTSGVPKGVEIGHGSFANYLYWASQHYADSNLTNMPLYSSLAFDLTLTSVFLPLITGGRVVVYGEESGTSQLVILDVLKDDCVDIVKLTPSHLQLALSASKSHKGQLCKYLRALILGGENFPRSLAVEARTYFGESIRIYNEYGPTEATIGCMIHCFNPQTDSSTSVPIGRPIKNSEIYLLDNCEKPVPIGFEGQIYIGGQALAMRYRGGHKIFGKLYASGDRAIQLNNENIVYLGRIGSQVKFRGARVELSEIELCLMSSDFVEEACVVVRNNQVEKLESLCQTCGISSRVPRIVIASNGVCNVCRDFEDKRTAFSTYFKNLKMLQRQLKNRLNDNSIADCLVLVSGGKDSSYTLCKIVEMGFRPVIFTLDNGYLSQHALDNIERMSKRLGLEWVRECPNEMHNIFADSLKRHSNVCDGCFKTIYTLATNYADANGIPSIITGLSRGQLFETRLMDMVDADVFDEKEIDSRVLQARLAYHQIDDAVADHLDVRICRNPTTYNRIEFFDFYRYCDVSLSDMLSFLNEYGDWRRPPDTGRSTNCLINDVGIYVHQQERQHHNYAVPYAWDVRMGHKTRLQAVDELNDELDMDRVREMLSEINYEPVVYQQTSEQQLVAYCTTSSLDEDIEGKLRNVMKTSLPDYTMPTSIVVIDNMPLTASGKVDIGALPAPGQNTGAYQGPENDIEAVLVTLWETVFSQYKVGINDNFFSLGGDSIAAVQISAAAQDTDFVFVATDLFNYPTIHELAKVVTKKKERKPTPNRQVNTGLDESELSVLLSRMGDKGVS